MKGKTVILAGSGHAHLELIKALSKEELRKNRFIMISPSRQTYYSGLIPRFIAGEIEALNLTIQSAEFAEKKGIQFVQDSVLNVDYENNRVFLASGRTQNFDLLSLNVGGMAKQISTYSPLKTIYLKPFEEFHIKWQEIETRFKSSPRFMVVGGGAAAVEVATALQHRLNRNQNSCGRVLLVTQGHRLCEGYSPRISRQILNSLSKLGVQVYLNEPVTEIQDQCIILKSRERLKFDFIFILTSTQTAPFIQRKTDSTLRIALNVFAVGDCVEMAADPNLPKSGVLAIHQGRHLANNIRCLLNEEPLNKFVPRKHFINILLSANKSARFVWGRFSFEGLLALKIKNWIDERYMKGFETQNS